MSDAADQCRMFLERNGIMMDLRQYILSVTVAAMICALVQQLLDKKGTAATIGKMLTGLFLTFTVIHPFANLHLMELGNFTMSFDHEAASAVAQGQALSKNALRESITKRTEAYILDKARQLDLKLTVEVTVSQDDIPIPERVRLKGNVSPYAKARLQSILVNDLGIAKEKQIWI